MDTTTPPPHSSHLRRGRHSEPGRIYLITTTTLNREAVFRELTCARQFIQTLQVEASAYQVRTLAYVVMPDHIHWLMQLNEESLSRVVGRVKRVSAARCGRRIWQSGFHDRAAREEDDVKAMARYVVANPIRAGLVESVGDYPHWDAIWL